MDVSLNKLQEIVRGREAWHATVYGLQRVRHDSATKHNNDRAIIVFSREQEGTSEVL